MKFGRQREKIAPSPWVARRRTSRSSLGRFGARPGSGRSQPIPQAAGRPPPDRFRRGRRWAAARLRAVTGVTGFDLERGHHLDQRIPWLGLLLWALAGASLVVSLFLRPDPLEREPGRVAGQTVAADQTRAALGPAVGESAFSATESAPR